MAGMNVKWCCCHFGVVLIVQKIKPYEPSNSTQRCYNQENWKHKSAPKTCTQIVPAALFVIAKRWKQLLKTEVGISIRWNIIHPWEETKHGCMYNMNIKSCWVTKKKNQIQRPHILWIQLHEVSRIVKFIETENRLVVTRGWEEGLLRVQDFFLGWWKFSGISGDNYTTLWMY